MKISTSVKAFLFAISLLAGCDLPDAESEQPGDALAGAEQSEDELRARPNTGNTETCMAECKRVRCVDGTIRNCDAYCTTYCYFKDILGVSGATTLAATTNNTTSPTPTAVSAQ